MILYTYSDQAEFMKGRYQKNNVKRVRNLISYVHTSRFPTLFCFIDAEKAFDGVEWLYLKELLIFMGPGCMFSSWIDSI